MKYRILLIFCLLWIIVSPFIAEFLIVEKPIARSDAIVVLSGSATYSERTTQAALLYKKGVSRKIFLTNDGERAGWVESKQRNPAFFELAFEELVSHGVKPEDIEILSPQVNSTLQEAELLARVVEDRQLRSILIVTSAYHARRAEMIFESKIRNSQIGIISAPTGLQTPSPWIWWLFPMGWKMVAGEYLKILIFTLSLN